MGVLVYCFLYVICIFVCVCVISNQSTRKTPRHPLDLRNLAPF